MMTVLLAQELAAKPLRFGDPEQIEALKILSLVQELLSLGVEIDCPRCSGTGSRRCSECGQASACRECEGRGTVPVDKCGELGASELCQFIAKVRVGGAA